jgi:hypothetical protein
MKIRAIASAFACALGLGIAVSGAQASLITFDLTYTGAPFGNSATATGSITFDDTVLPNPGNLANVSAAALGVTGFSITVSGASSGNGTFAFSDVTNWVWLVGAPLNLGAELVGQPGFNDFNWCAFNFVGCTPPAPGGVSAFTIRTNAETGDFLVLTSMAPAQAPEPLSLALLGIGLAGVGFARRNVIR